MVKPMNGFVFLPLLVPCVCSAVVLEKAPAENVRLKGFVADRLEGCVRRHVKEADLQGYAAVFGNKDETGLWQSEFWGKYMHSVASFWRFSQDAGMLRKMNASAAQVLSSQGDDGYVGNYPPEARSGEGWDVWGNKYTLLGLLHHFKATGDRKSLAGAAKLADYLMSVFGPGRKSLAKSGNFRGMPSCSVLEPIVWLYRETHEGRYLDFARYIVSEMDAEDGARLLRDAGKPVADRVTDGTVKGSGLKSYEMMSCCQGLLDYYDVTKDEGVFHAVEKTAESIRMTEVNIAGGLSSSERWYRGAEKQAKTYFAQQETCVQTTWMRLAGKLLEETGDPKWAEEIEKTFYNAYLASLSADNDLFSQYCPLTGTRSRGAYHCRLHTNCCNANGPRGFLAFLEYFLMSAEDAAYLNFYASGRSSVRLPSGEAFELEQFTLYPAEGDVDIRIRRAPAKPAALALRIPAWAETVSVTVNGRPVETAASGTYCRIARQWTPGDVVLLSFGLPVRVHVLDGHVAFTRGPLTLARDRRFEDGDLSEAVRPAVTRQKTVRMESLAPRKGMWTTFAGALPMGTHADNPEQGRSSMVFFCDYASAGNTWAEDSFYRVWLPLELEDPRQ